MKIQAIKKLCEERETFLLFDTPDGRQWLCNGIAAWPVEGMRMNEDMIPAIFDLNEKKQEKFNVNQRVYMDQRFTQEPRQGEKPLEDWGLVYEAGMFYRALHGENGLMLIDAAQQKPAERKDVPFRYFERNEAGKTPLVACYADMLCGALIMPVMVCTLMERLERIATADVHKALIKEEENA